MNGRVIPACKNPHSFLFSIFHSCHITGWLSVVDPSKQYPILNLRSKDTRRIQMKQTARFFGTVFSVMFSNNSAD